MNQHGENMSAHLSLRFHVNLVFSEMIDASSPTLHWNSIQFNKYIVPARIVIYKLSWLNHMNQYKNCMSSAKNFKL